MEERKLIQKLYDEFIIFIHPYCNNELEQLAKCKEYCVKHITFDLELLCDEDIKIEFGDHEYNVCMNRINFYIEKIMEINKQINEYDLLA